jgi:DMSO/TMAO reductase YedYZ molybdopterin-dependent catalytic subunit
VHPDNWRLRIHGRVRTPITLSLDDLLRRPLVERHITLACVSNEVGGDLTGNARWRGVPVRGQLDAAEPLPGADQVVGGSADGWTCGTPTAVPRDGRGALLAVGMNGEPLPIEHGSRSGWWCRATDATGQVQRRLSSRSPPTGPPAGTRSPRRSADRRRLRHMRKPTATGRVLLVINDSGR